MTLIKLTLFNTKTPIYLNVEMIGSISDVVEKECSTSTKQYTLVGHLTHNNGGFRVIENVDKILKLIKEATNCLYVASI